MNDGTDAAAKPDAKALTPPAEPRRRLRRADSGASTRSSASGRGGAHKATQRRRSTSATRRRHGGPVRRSSMRKRGRPSRARNDAAASVGSSDTEAGRAASPTHRAHSPHGQGDPQASSARGQRRASASSHGAENEHLVGFTFTSFDGDRQRHEAAPSAPSGKAAPGPEGDDDGTAGAAADDAGNGSDDEFGHQLRSQLVEASATARDLETTGTMLLARDQQYQALRAEADQAAARAARAARDVALMAADPSRVHGVGAAAGSSGIGVAGGDDPAVLAALAPRTASDALPPRPAGASRNTQNDGFGHTASPGRSQQARARRIAEAIASKASLLSAADTSGAQAMAGDADVDSDGDADPDGADSVATGATRSSAQDIRSEIERLQSQILARLRTPAAGATSLRH